MCFGYRPSEIVQDWLPASLSVIPNTAFLRRVSIPLADVTAWYSPRFRAGRDEMSACVKSIVMGPWTVCAQARPARDAC